MLIVINTCYGGFSLSDEAQSMLRDVYRVDPDDFTMYSGYENRSSMALVNTVKALGDKANGSCAELAVVEIPDDVEWTIEEYDGVEWVAEKHRVWRA